MTDYYSLLRISPQASKLDIINAYRHAKLTYRKDSLAVYSLYSEEELASIRQEIDKAYAVLSDREKRQAYDVEHGHAPAGGAGAVHDFAGTDDNGHVEERVEHGADSPAATFSMPRESQASNVVPLHRRKPRDHDPDLERRMQSAEEYSGRFLREVREYRGIDLEEVAGQTRIAIAYLRAIEAEDMSALPARAYLKGYLGQYAAEIGLEPHRVVQGYPPLSDSPAG